MSKQIPLVQPYLPSLDEIASDLRRMLDSGRLSNLGPFSGRLEQEAAEPLQRVAVKLNHNTLSKRLRLRRMSSR